MWTTGAPLLRRRGLRVLVAALAAAGVTAGLPGGPAVAAPAEAPGSRAASSVRQPVSGPTAASTASGRSGSFVSPCGWSHRKADDPVVAPRRPGGSHPHDFFGNRSTDAFSTDATWRAAGTTCSRTRDTAAYWLPTLLDHGTPVAPRVLRVYYRTGGLRDTRALQALPAGLRVIAGDAKARSAQPLSVASWACTRPGGGADGDEQEVAELPRTCQGQPLRLKVVFPNCWNGRDLDSPDHKSHLAYAVRGRCPSTHPVAVPQVVLAARYRLPGSLEGVTLASHGTYSAHADLVNTWHQPTLERLVAQCLRAGRHCGDAGER